MCPEVILLESLPRLHERARLVDLGVDPLLPLHEADGAGRARANVDGELAAHRDDRSVRAAEREVQETERVEQWLGLGAEQLEQDPAAGFRRARAPGMSVVWGSPS